MSACFAFLVLWLTLMTMTHSATNTSRIRSRRQNQELPSFPSVYTTSLLQKDLPSSADIIAEMDLLHVDCSSSSRGQCQVFTLIHSQSELQYLQGMVSLAYDRNSTEAIVAPRRMLQDAVPPEEQHTTMQGMGCYLNLQGMLQWLENFVANAPPHLDVELIEIGNSYLKTVDAEEGFIIHALRITSATASRTPKNPLMILSGVHPREYAPPELVRQWVSEFLDADNLELQTILESTEIHWIPYVNPDGRLLAETTQPWRRKNMNPNAAGSEFCGDAEVGVDLNRNFPFRWGRSTGSSTRACMQTFRGASEGSEPETQAVIQYAQSVFPASQRKILDDFHLEGALAYDEDTTSGVFVDIHSYGNYYIFPWGFENSVTPNQEALEAMVRKMAHWTEYGLRGPGADYTDPASGATDDWSYGVLGAAGMTWELGNSFHQDCDTFRDDIVEKNLKALTYTAKLTSRPYSLSKGPDVTKVEIQPSGTIEPYASVTLEIEASDSAYSSVDYQTARQNIEEIRIYVDQHPYNVDVSSPSVVLTELNEGKGAVTLTWEDLSSLMTETYVGTHTIYVEAMDDDGYVGPITAVSLTVTPFPTADPSESPAPSKAPSSEPTLSPQPTTVPTSLPSTPPTSKPTTLAPSSLPTITPQPTPCVDSDAPICAYISRVGELNEVEDNDFRHSLIRSGARTRFIRCFSGWTVVTTSLLLFTFE